MVRGRFAPSPTGELHLGNARTALLAWLQVRAQQGRFVMRVEDLDTARTVPGAMQRQLDALSLLGIDWDEGPFLQSERTALYEEALARLAAEDRVYPCFCSRAEIARAATAPHGPGDDGPRYPGTCAALTGAERAARTKERRPAVRFRVRPGLVGFEDRVLGHVAQDVREKVGDFVVRRADGVFAYQLAVVVDDIAMGMTEVLRGDDLTVSTPRQLLLYEALGAVPPRFTHVPLVLGPSGERLSKRDGPVSVAALVERGVSPERICGVLGRMCGLEGTTAREWVGRFDLGRLPPGAPRFDPQALLDSRDANAVTTDDAAAGPSGPGPARGPASAH